MNNLLCPVREDSEHKKSKKKISYFKERGGRGGAPELLIYANFCIALKKSFVCLPPIEEKRQHPL